CICREDYWLFIFFFFVAFLSCFSLPFDFGLPVIFWSFFSFGNIFFFFCSRSFYCLRLRSKSSSTFLVYFFFSFYSFSLSIGFRLLVCFFSVRKFCFFFFHPIIKFLLGLFFSQRSFFYANQ